MLTSFVQPMLYLLAMGLGVGALSLLALGIMAWLWLPKKLPE